MGIRAATHFNQVMVFIKLAALILFILLGVPHIHFENWHPFIPENGGVVGEFGWSGIFRGAGLIFFAYVGFDTVAAFGHDTVDPQKNLPRGIMGSLGIVTVVYILTAIVLTGMVSYTLLNVPDPMSVALKILGPKFFWLGFVIKLAILAALASVILIQLLGQTRVFYAIGKDGLLPHRFSKVHHRMKTPLFSLAVTAVISMALAGLFPVEILGELVSITTLFLFAISSAAVWILRYRHPEFERPFRVRFLPAVAFCGITACLTQMCFLSLTSWIELIAWLLLGLLVYFTYGIKNSKLRSIHK
jgi:APA family basic amino acid/polyamine antiporter